MQHRIGSHKILRVFIILLLITDLGYTFLQNYDLNIDGDVASIVAPSNHYKDVLNDPFGYNVLVKKSRYAATNRYFAHATMIIYFKPLHQLISPLFKDKVRCLYFMSAAFNVSVQFLLIILLSIIITGHFKLFRIEFLLTALILTPFFQQHGYHSSIGIIDNSVTYTFFYALPVALLLLFFLPLLLAFRNKQPISKYFNIKYSLFWIFLAIYLSFSGPIIQPLILLFSPILMILINREDILPDASLKLNIPKSFLFVWVGLFLFCLYSFYIGQFNIESANEVPLTERYKLLAKGLVQFFFHQKAFIIIGALLLINYLIIQFTSISSSKRSNYWLIITIILAILYILLLPLGGYRPYRPWIIRYDVFIPVTILILFFIGSSTLKILLNKSRSDLLKFGYPVFLFAILIWFTIVDKPHFDKNACQKAALYQLSAATESVVELEQSCNVLRWEKIKHPEHSEVVGKMLYYWGITDKIVLYHQK